MPLNSLSPFFKYWRTHVVVDRQVVDAVVAPRHEGPSPDLRAALKQWPGTYYWEGSPGARRLVLIRILKAAPPERWFLHLGLFVLTFLTMWVVGSMLMSLLVRFLLLGSLDLTAELDAIRNWTAASKPALGFAFALMGILLTHEMGHYITARRYLINTSLPYFLPAPPAINFIGTFGAFIRLRSPIVDRRQLFDVGAAGPWAGVVVAMAVLIVGLQSSQPVTNVVGESHQFVYLFNTPWFLGDSILMDVLRRAILGDVVVALHPLAVAGWVGVFVTMLNLLPLGQLDGGHIVYALAGKRQATVARLMWYGLLVLGLQFPGWWIWAALILILGRGRISHPSVLDPATQVPRSRWPLGLATAVLFIISFSVDPFPSV